MRAFSSHLQETTGPCFHDLWWKQVGMETRQVHARWARLSAGVGEVGWKVTMLIHSISAYVSL